MMKVLLRAIVCFQTICLALFAQEVERACLVKSDAWVQGRIVWSTLPKQIGSRVRTTKATLYSFGDDGVFVRLGCRLIRQTDGSIAISLGDGYSLYRGTWKVTRSVLHIRYSLVSARLLPLGGRLPGPEQIETGSARKACAGKLSIMNVKYVELEGLEQDGMRRLDEYRHPK